VAGGGAVRCRRGVDLREVIGGGLILLDAFGEVLRY